MRIKFYICPRADKKHELRPYLADNEKIDYVDWSECDCEFFDNDSKNGSHHWLPSCAFEYAKLILKDLGKKYDEKNHKEIILYDKDKAISYFVPITGRYKIYDRKKELKQEGNADILYTIQNKWGDQYHIYQYTHTISTVVNDDIKTGNLLLIGDSMAIPIVLTLCPYFHKITYIDSRDSEDYDLEKYDINECSDAIAIRVNMHTKNEFVKRCADYYAEKLS